MNDLELGSWVVPNARSREFLLFAFVPYPFAWLPYLVFGSTAGLFLAILLVFISLSTKRNIFAFFGSFLAACCGLICLVSCSFFWWLHTPRHDYNEIAEFSRPGMHIDLVVEEFGKPDEISYSTGMRTYTYYETNVVGIIELSVDSEGLITGIDHYD